MKKVSIEQMERELQYNPYDRFMDFHVLKADEDDTELVFHNVGTKWGNPNGTLYGGVLYSMADSAMETACAVAGKAAVVAQVLLYVEGDTHPAFIYIVNLTGQILEIGNLRNTLADIKDAAFQDF